MADLRTPAAARGLAWISRGPCGCILGLCVTGSAEAVRGFLNDAEEEGLRAQLVSLVAAKREFGRDACPHRPLFQIEKTEDTLRFVLRTKDKPSARTLSRFFGQAQAAYDRICAAAGVGPNELVLDPGAIRRLPDDGRHDLYLTLPLVAAGRNDG